MTLYTYSNIYSAIIREARPDDLDTIVDFNLCLARETKNKALDQAKEAILWFKLF